METRNTGSVTNYFENDGTPAFPALRALIGKPYPANGYFGGLDFESFYPLVENGIIADVISATGDTSGMEIVDDAYLVRTGATCTKNDPENDDDCGCAACIEDRIYR